MVGKNKAAGPPSAPRANLVREDVLLAPHTTLGVGGRARYFAECRSTAEVRDCLVWARERKLQVQVMGGGSNILFADEGFGGLVLKVALRGVAYADQGEWVLMRSGAGEDWDRLVRDCIRRGLGGIECLSGIPGLVGATPVQNVGAYGQEVKETVVRVEAIERETLAEVAFTNAECGFSYRQSRFKSEDRDRHIITMVSFRLRPRARACLRYPELQRHVRESADLERLESGAPVLGAVRRAVLELRRGKSMVLDPADPNARSAGSFFLNPVLSREEFGEFKERCIAAGCGGEMPVFETSEGLKVAAAWLVERAGFHKSYRRGGVGISSNHALALVNRGGGSCRELVELSDDIQRQVYEKFAVRLEREPVVVEASR